MQWLSLLMVLVCPLMMLFCMKGMFSGHKHNKGKDQTQQTTETSEGIQSLEIKIAELMKQNQLLSREVDSLKTQSETVTSPENRSPSLAN